MPSGPRDRYPKDLTLLACKETWQSILHEFLTQDQSIRSKWVSKLAVHYVPCIAISVAARHVICTLSLKFTALQTNFGLAQGTQGLTLPQGTQGLTLPQGTQGLTLPQGTQGLTLPQGTQGLTLPQGTQGLTLPQGTQGLTLPF